MSRDAKIIAVLAVLLLAPLVFRESFVVWKNSLSGAVEQLAGKPLAWVSGAFRSDDLEQENQSLRMELAVLQAELANPLNGSNGWLNGYLTKAALIYSSYPFNHRSLLTINQGAASDLKPLMPVITKEGILVGQIAEVFPTYSLVRTIFDPGWELAVRVDRNSTDALLVGGAVPTLTLIEKKQSAEVGDLIYSAGRNFPYGLAIGTLQRLTFGDSDLFKRAELKTPYELSALREVRVITNFLP